MKTIELTQGGPGQTEPAVLTPSEKDHEIERILDAGLVKQSSVKSCLCGLYRALGLRYLLWDTSEALFLSALTAALLLLIQPLTFEAYKYTALFCCSPLLFVTVLFLTETLERTDGLYELKMTCRHTIRQVAALRVLLLCALGMVFSFLITARYSIGLSEFWKLLPLVFAAFFLCAFLYLVVVRRVRKKWAHGAAVLLWVVVSGLPAAFFPNEWELFLAKLPAAVTAAVMLAAGVLCFIEGKSLLGKPWRTLMLFVDRVTKKYGSFTALEDITLEFNYGVYGLLAPNGAGKTTLIKMLTTLIFPTSGEILWNGDDIVKLDDAYRGVIGYLPQEFGYYKNHTPHEFLMYLSALKGMERKAASKQADELLEFVSLSDVRNKKMRKFSGGMIQRVGIAQALQNDPKILILDEPTAGLDPKERVRFRNLISTLSKDRIVILSTHIVSDIETIANSVIMFKDHRLLCDDAPADICQTLAGRVFETDAVESVKEPYLTLTERQENGRTVTRFACDAAFSGTARPVSPTLEDVFLYVYRDEAAL